MNEFVNSWKKCAVVSKATKNDEKGIDGDEGVLDGQKVIQV